MVETQLELLTTAKGKNRIEGSLYVRASWGAAVLRPYGASSRDDLVGVTWQVVALHASGALIASGRRSTVQPAPSENSGCGTHCRGGGTVGYS